MEGTAARVPPDVEASIKDVAGRENAAEAAFVLASIANRAAAALHQLARAQSSAHKGKPDWGRWASLANVSRDAILRTATSRQTANQLMQAARNPGPPSEPSA